MLPPLLVASIFAKQLLTLWLGHSFAIPVLPIFQLMVVGIFVNSTAHVPYALLQAFGRSDLTAKLHLLELPFFIGLLIWAVSNWGVYGAALAWTLRVVLDTGMLYGWAVFLQHGQRTVLIQALGLGVISSCVLLLPLFTYNLFVLAPVVICVLASCAIMLVRLYRKWRFSTPLIA